MAKPIEGMKGVFQSVLKLGAIATILIGVLGAAIGYAVASTFGVISALIGATICFAFSSLTALSVWFGSKLNLGGFFGLVLGGWLLKLVLFFIVIATLRKAEFISGPVFFFTLIASILVGLGIDSYVFLKARIPIEPAS